MGPPVRSCPAQRCISNAMQGGFAHSLVLVSLPDKRRRAAGISERCRLSQPRPQPTTSASRVPGRQTRSRASRIASSHSGSHCKVPGAGAQAPTIHIFTVNREDGNACLPSYIRRTKNPRLSCTSLAKASRTGHDLSLIEKPADSSEKNQPIPDRKISVYPIVKVVFPGLTSNIGTLLNDKCGVLDSRRQRLSLLARRHRTHILLPVRYQYGSWTHNLSLDPPYAGGTPDPPRVATRSHDSGRACPTGADDLTRR